MRSPVLRLSCRNVRGSTVPSSVTTKQQQEKPVTPFALKPRDEPAYIRYTPEQRDYYWRGLVRKQGKFIPHEMSRDEYEVPELVRPEPQKQVDPESEPFRQIYQGNEDHGNFSAAEVVDRDNVWFWVQRVLPDNSPPDLPYSDSRERMPSGWIPPPITPPDRSYFVRRLPNGLFPVSKQLIHREVIRTKRVDDHVFDQHPDVLTLVELVDGEIRDLEHDLLQHIQSIKKKKVLSAVSEFQAMITFKGNHVDEVVQWLEENGF